MSNAPLLGHPAVGNSNIPVAGVMPEMSGLPWKQPTLLDRILVATDGSRAGGAALRIARELLAHKRSQVGQVRVVTVLHRPALVGTGDLVIDTAEQGALATPSCAYLARIRRQVRAAGVPGWELHVEFGSPARAIRAAAVHTAATLIVLGIGRHRAAGRLFGADTAGRVIAGADVAVLAVNADATTLGHSAVAAVDFSATSARAARAALNLLAPPASLHLVHVRPRFESAPPEMEGYQHIYMSGVEAALDELYASLPKVEGVKVGSFAITGQPDAALLDFAGRLDAGFIAVGRHGHRLGERLLIGSTTNALLAATTRPVLVMPPASQLTTRR